MEKRNRSDGKGDHKKDFNNYTQKGNYFDPNVKSIFTSERYITKPVLPLITVQSFNNLKYNKED